MATNSATSLHPYLHQRPLSHFHRHHHYHTFPTTTPLAHRSFSPRPRRRRRPTRRNKNKHSSLSNTSSSDRLQFILDVHELKTRTPLPLQTTLDYLRTKYNQLISSSIDAYTDIRTLVVVEPGTNRVLVSCSESTVRFVGGLLIWSCVGFVFVRILVKLGLGLGFRRRSEGVRVEVVTRRDRSLGGREVVVERRVVKGGERNSGGDQGGSKVMPRVVSRRKEERKLPQWWPVIGPRSVVEVNREEYRREANQLVQAIMDDKLRGKDVSEEDILELHRICRKSGIQLSFGTENAQDSFYRLAVLNVINTCCRVGSPSVEIDGEDACLFVAGLAYDVGLFNPRAATIVSAAVAAQTRQWFLQAWALEMQMKQSEALEELKKICLIHQIFPPEPYSPEMEMVARGLQKHLKLEDREFLLRNLASVCGGQSPRSAAEALGLV